MRMPERTAITTRATTITTMTERHEPQLSATPFGARPERQLGCERAR